MTVLLTSLTGTETSWQLKGLYTFFSLYSPNFWLKFSPYPYLETRQPIILSKKREEFETLMKTYKALYLNKFQADPFKMKLSGTLPVCKSGPIYLSKMITVLIYP